MAEKHIIECLRPVRYILSIHFLPPLSKRLSAKKI